MPAEQLTYLTTVFFVGATTFWLLRWFLHRSKNVRLKRAHKKDAYQAIATTSPVTRPISKAKEIALESIESRFTIVRRTLSLALFIVWFIALILPFIGNIPTAVISILIGASGIILGIAARPVIENLIAGIVITFSSPIRTGDTVLIDGNYGTIEDITMTYTIIKIWDWRRYVIPNAKMIAKEFANLTLNDSYQWAYVDFWISLDADLSVVEATARAAARNSQHFSNYESPSFWVLEMGKEAARCRIAAWTESPTDAWQLSHDIRTELIKQLNILHIKPHRYAMEISDSTVHKKPNSAENKTMGTRKKEIKQFEAASRS